MKKTFVLSLRTPLLLSALLAATQLASAATDTWNGTDNGTWSDANNWSGGNAPPQAGDSLLFGNSSATAILNNDLTPGLAIDGITFLGAQSLTLNGHSILLSGQVYANTLGMLNESGNPQTFGMNLGLDWGYYTFTGIIANGLALNGTLTNALGGVAYFDPYVTSTSLTADGTTGLIAGLGGAGLMYNGTIPTGLATISGGAISAYTGYTPVASGLIGSGNNLELTASGAATAFTANNNTVNTITADQAGNSGGTATDTLTTTGTLTLGQNGGIYALNGGANKNLLTVTSGSLTAGTAAGATIVLGANGTTSGNSPPNMMTVSSIIANNPGGAVSVVKVGTGSIVVNGANTYSGGTFLLQGQIQIGNVTGLGTGPLYVAQGATAFLNSGNGTYANDMYISPGNGSSLWNSTGLNPGALVLPTAGSGTTFFNGKLTLLGAPVPAATYPPTAGCRLTGDKDATEIYNFQNQITGPGTLDLNASPHAAQILLNNNPNNHPLNDWQGGLIIEESLGSASSARNIIVQLGFDNQIPHGASAGDVTLYTADTSAFATLVRLDLNGHNNTINGLNGSYNSHPPFVSNFGSAPSVLTIGDNNASGSFAGSMSDNTGANNLSLVKIGNGTQTFTGALGHHGSTTVNGGAFKLSGSATMANTPVITVASSATFDASDLGGFTLSAAQTLNCVGTVLGNNTTINGTVEALDPIGTLTVGSGGSMTFNSGGAFVWDINNATGTAGSDPGWSMINVGGALYLGSLGASSFTINVTSLDLTDAAGSAANFNPLADYSWRIAYAAGGISGFSSGQFSIVTSAFANHPNSSSQWSVSVDGTGDYLMLNYSGFAVITTPLPVTPLVVNQNNTAIFTVTANSLGTGPSFAWTQNGNPLSNGGQSAGGAPGNVTIATSNGGYTSTLTITGVDAAAYADSGTITVNATETYNSSMRNGSSSQVLTVVDIPYNPTVTPSVATPPNYGGSVDTLSAAASGTEPFTYQWYLNGNEINGATGSNLTVNITSATTGNYTVVIGNSAGSVTSTPYLIAGPISQVPNQILYEPFNYDLNSGGNPYTWTAPGVQQIYNQATGVGLTWTQVGNNDFGTRAGPIDTYEGFTWLTTPPGAGSRPLITDQYPVEGLAGDSAHIIYIDTDVNGGQENLHFGTGGAISSGKVYASFVIQLFGFDAAGASGNHLDYLCGLGTGAANSTTHSVGIYINQPLPANGWPNIGYALGVFKGNLTTGALNPGVNGDWAPGNPSVPPGNLTAFLDYDILFVVLRYNIDPGGFSTCDMWVNPDRSFFYTNEDNLPTPTVAGVAGGVADQAGAVSLFWAKATTYPVDRNLLDVRVGTTWASVTPPAAPTLSLANALLRPTDTVAVLASQNAGNPVNSGGTAGSPPYQWQFTAPNGSPITLTDGTGPSGHSTISGSGTDTLTITNPAPGDLGTYTVAEINTSPSSYDAGIPNASYGGTGLTYTNSMSAILTTTAPSLNVAASGGNVTVSWPVNWAVELEGTTSLAAPIAWTPVSGGESSFVYWPPGSGLLSWVPVSPITISGTNYTVTGPASGNQMFFRLAPSP